MRGESLLLLGLLALASGASLPEWPGPDNWDDFPDATYEVIHDREVITTEPPDEPRGILFTMHGCLQMVTEWGHQSDACPSCHGMPEETMTVWRAVRRGYAVVALGPHLSGDPYHCFNNSWPLEDYVEMPTMVRTLHAVLSEHGWWGLPRYALGSSRGGAFALLLALRFPLQGVASMVMGVKPPEALATGLQPRNPASGAEWRFPPTLLLHAQHDTDDVLESIAATVPVLRAQGTEVQEMEMRAYPLTPATFAQRLKGISGTVSEALYARLRARGLIDAASFASWRNFLPKWEDGQRQLNETLAEILPTEALPPDLQYSHGGRGADRAFKELLWASEAIHEQTAQHTDAMLDFFEATTDAEHERVHAGHPFVRLAPGRAVPPDETELVTGPGFETTATALRKDGPSLGREAEGRALPSAGSATGPPEARVDMAVAFSEGAADNAHSGDWAAEDAKDGLETELDRNGEELAGYEEKLVPVPEDHHALHHHHAERWFEPAPEAGGDLDGSAAPVGVQGRIQEGIETGGRENLGTKLREASSEQEGPGGGAAMGTGRKGGAFWGAGQTDGTESSALAIAGEGLGFEAAHLTAGPRHESRGISHATGRTEEGQGLVAEGQAKAHHHHHIHRSAAQH